MKKRGRAKPQKPSRRRRATDTVARHSPRLSTRVTGRVASGDSDGFGFGMAMRRTAAAVSRAVTYPSDDRQALALLLLPFLIVAVSIGLNQSLKPAGRLLERGALERAAPKPAQPGSIALAPITMPAAVPAALRAPERLVVPGDLLMPSLLPRIAVPAAIPAAPFAPAVVPRALAPIDWAMAIPHRQPALPTAPPPIIATVATPAVMLPAAAPIVPPPPAVRLPAVAFVAPVAPEVLARLSMPISLPRADFALPATAPVVARPVSTPPLTLSARPPDILAYGDTASEQVCRPQASLPSHRSIYQGADFGERLAQAAAEQTRQFVIYNATYKRIAYPMGDVPSLYGACSDVIIRAYRALGIDLQELVQRSGIGSGDTNIDHRRTETLRAFFTRHGEKLTISEFGEDYRPGDIVTYFRPYSRVSRAHIAIVSDRIGPSGQPMIIHNRGWGPQYEDALFVDRITGHYRFSGAPALQPTPTSPAVADRARRAPPRTVRSVPAARSAALATEIR